MAPWATASVSEKLSLAALAVHDSFGGRAALTFLHGAATAYMEMLEEPGRRGNETLSWDQVRRPASATPVHVIVWLLRLTRPA